MVQGRISAVGEQHAAARRRHPQKLGFQRQNLLHSACSNSSSEDRRRVSQGVGNEQCRTHQRVGAGASNEGKQGGEDRSCTRGCDKGGRCAKDVRHPEPLQRAAIVALVGAYGGGGQQLRRRENFEKHQSHCNKESGGSESEKRR